jgi:hypothetical protein
MHLALMITNAILAVLFLYAGGTKLVVSKASLLAMDGMAWAADYSEPALKAIGLAEVLGAIGLVVPLLTGIVPFLAPIAAVGLFLVMLGAAQVHRRRREPLLLPTTLAALTLVSLWLGLVVNGVTG